MGPSLILSAAGYARMTQAALDSLLDERLISGWLDNVELQNLNIGIGNPLGGVNWVQTSATLQFTPWGMYSDGARRALFNSNFAGSSGTWASSNPT